MFRLRNGHSFAIYNSVCFNAFYFSIIVPNFCSFNDLTQCCKGQSYENSTHPWLRGNQGRWTPNFCPLLLLSVHCIIYDNPQVVLHLQSFCNTLFFVHLRKVACNQSKVPKLYLYFSLGLTGLTEWNLAKVMPDKYEHICHLLVSWCFLIEPMLIKLMLQIYSSSLLLLCFLFVRLILYKKCMFPFTFT